MRQFKITLLNPILTHLLKPMLPAPHQTAGIQILEHLTMSPMSPKTFSKSLLLRVQTKLPLVMVKGFLLIPRVIQNLLPLLIPMFLFVLQICSSLCRSLLLVFPSLQLILLSLILLSMWLPHLVASSIIQI